MLPVVEKGITGEPCCAIHQNVKANSKYIKVYDKSKESLYLKYWEANNLFGWTTSQKLPINGCKWVEETCKLNKDLMKSYNEYSDEG